MKATTARAIQRLKQSSDFTTLIDYLSEEREVSITTLTNTSDDVIVRRQQGTIQFLNKLLADINESGVIARTH